ncbi:hypothetical protein BDQ94DRAFT_173972 [Aspergillus welwitschiae]|uniref:ATP-grasp domain-containing protein n=1 Tax=Aspergillus welwitschiae TaxID=1341132 RepID=A0A3F3PQF2_9EURO|nr:hypothetical protein BDQ94DRAFT_173972 [Aspergillus welwitschiae]RDH29181.1 hypothetical protein BDQ94DRAFT_173972 [Aspergillus welwitschiae]
MASQSLASRVAIKIPVQTLLSPFSKRGVKIIKSDPAASVSSHKGWAFPDTEQGICSAIPQGATHLWANTILFNSHPLQTSSKLTPLVSEIYVVGQPPSLVENFDDKAYLNDKLRELGRYTLPSSWVVSPKDFSEVINKINSYPIVGKPQHIQTLLHESPLVMLEEFLAGEEATITVMPPTRDRPQHWSMLPVTRFNHAEGIAPYNGVVAVTANSRAISPNELKDPAYEKVMRECESVAALIGATAPIRVDVRRFAEGSDFALLDINMKPVDRGAKTRRVFTAIAASAMGWDYSTLLQNILMGTQPLNVFRNYKSPF